MRAVVQRVSEASVSVGGELVSRIGRGQLVLLAVSKTDAAAAADTLAEKIVHLRIFEDQGGKLNRSLLDVGGEMLVVSQFTLLADCTKGRRPSFVDAAPPEEAERLYGRFAARAAACGVPVRTGRFRALMAVALVNDGPVTLILEA
jgi:D-tyrosyl-tRNA(Tyr) deacylase